MNVGVWGAGAVGGYLGIRLSAAGVPVTMVARAAMVEQADALVAYDLSGRIHRPRADLRVTEDPTALADADVCLVTVKSRDTVQTGKTLSRVLPPRTLVISFQNGLRNAERLRTALRNPVLGGMVGFNVIRDGPRFVQATRAPLVTGPAPAKHAPVLEALVASMREAGLPVQVRADIDAVLAGKLLLNLNNAVCAVTGASIAQSLRDRRLRWCFARLMREGWAVMRAAGIRPANVVGLPPWLIARVLAWPDAIVLRVVRRLVAIDPRARSSTLVDLEAGKPTEIDDLSGEIVRLGERVGHPAPANRVVVEAVHALEASGPPPRFWTPDALRDAIARATAQ